MSEENIIYPDLSIDSLRDTLGLTIKKDDVNKMITFLCQLSAYTYDSQFNIIFNAPSSAGKSYIPIEIAKLFPKEDVMELGHCTPNAFYHESGVYDKENNKIIVDLSQKIIVFLDQPHSQLLSKLRALLSHDKREIEAKITDKNQKGGNRTKTVVLKGFPSVIFCTVNSDIDDQESTRFMLLSPEVDKDKIEFGINEAIKKESDSLRYGAMMSENSERENLMERIRLIKEAKIKDINIENTDLVKELFFKDIKHIKPRHQRDIKRFMSLIKSIALLNLWSRKTNEDTIYANDDDIKEAYTLWQTMSESQELNIPPYALDIYRRAIWHEFCLKNEGKEHSQGLTRKEIIGAYMREYGQLMSEAKLRQNILPLLEYAGLIIQEPSNYDKRVMLVYPLENNIKTAVGDE